MKTENLEKALQTFALLRDELRAAHRDAANSDNLFAESAIFALLEMSSAFAIKLTRAGVDAGLDK